MGKTVKVLLFRWELGPTSATNDYWPVFVTQFSISIIHNSKMVTHSSISVWLHDNSISITQLSDF